MSDNTTRTWLDDLNQEQKEAATYGEGPLLILAGAGSGKTRALTYRVAYLVKEELIDPGRILLVTFTNKAAKEMKKRVESLTSGESLPWAGTFHSICARLLRIESQAAKLDKNFTIFDEQDSLDAVKTALENLDISTKLFKPRSIKAVISQAKNEMIGALEYQQMAKGPVQEVVAKVYPEYQRLMGKYGAVDFDDLLIKAVKLLKDNVEVLNKYRDKFQYVLVDEYQDTNQAQYLLTKLLASKWRNLGAVGDFSQCLPPSTKIKTDKGEKRVSDILSGDKVLSATGRGSNEFFKVSKVFKRKYKGSLIKITTENGKVLRLTPNHVLFSRLLPTPHLYHVYLMYKKGVGYRIGVAKSQRSNKSLIGVQTRGNQEKADRMWILKACSTKREASYWEYFYAFKYGVPTLVFFTAGRSMTIEQEDINNLFNEIDTEKRASKLMDDLLIDVRYPHFRAQGWSGRKSPDRQVVHLKFFQDPRVSQISPWCAHRISLNTSDRQLEAKVKKAGFYTRPGRQKTWRTEIMRLKYKEAEKIALRLKKVAGDIDVSYEAFLTASKHKLLFQPASHLRKYMAIAVVKNNQVVEEKILQVEHEKYDGYVYDLEVDSVHNYCANNVFVHNSIYSWRGADFRNLKKLQTDFPDIKVVNLEQNYRSTRIILEAANQVVRKNNDHPILKLWTDNAEGEKVKIYEANDEKAEVEFMVNTIKNSKDEYRDFAVLYRTNAQSRVIEEGFIREGVPYVLVGGVKFYSRKEVKDCLAYLRFVNNSKDGVSYERMEKIGKRRLRKFEDWLEENREKIKKMNSRKVLEEVFRVTGYLEKYDPKDEEDLSRLENIKELSSVTEEFEDLGEFLENVALVEQTDLLEKNSNKSESELNRVTLMTLHTSKGLEFKNVFMIGMEEGLFPHSRSVFDKQALEEERRLCYVGITRAREKLWLSHARSRLYFGSRSSNQASRFLADIEEELVEKMGGQDNWLGKRFETIVEEDDIINIDDY